MGDTPTLRWLVELTSEERDALLTQISIRKVTQARTIESGRLSDPASYIRTTELLGRAGDAISGAHMRWYKPEEDPDQRRRPRVVNRSAPSADPQRDAKPGNADSGS